MNDIPVREGVMSVFLETPRLRHHFLVCGPEEGTPVVLIHGNFSAALYWDDLMAALCERGYRCFAPDLRGYGWSEDKVIDSTRGYRDWSDDLDELFQALGIERAHLVGWSMGAGVAYRFIADHPEKVITATLQAPVSPYGFGGTKDAEGTLCFDDAAGSGGGVVNPTFVERVRMGDRTTDDPNSPRNVINAFYYHPGFTTPREEDYLTAALREKVGSDRYPGDSVPSHNWPGVGPGVQGPVNCWSPKYLRGEVDDLLAAEPKPPILWIRGDNDMIVSDNSMFDMAALGSLDYVPGWPGADVVPPQPMIQQVRAVLDRYKAAGGSYREVVFENCGHSPHIEYPDKWLDAFVRFAKP
jgi:pimeloyl-ACP methyl ester carboxylesterase